MKGFSLAAAPLAVAAVALSGCSMWMDLATEASTEASTESSTEASRAAASHGSRIPTSYSVFDPKAMNDPAWGASRIGFVVECDSVGHDQIDPIVSPGQARSAHLHEFFGNPGVTKDSTTEQLAGVAHSRIACSDVNDKSAYWSPAVYQNGRLVTATVFDAYYKSPTEDVVPVPFGLRMVAGDPHAKENQPAHVGGWVTDGADTFGGNRMIERRNNGSNMVLRVNYPQCWDGRNLDSPDHQSHMAYARGNSCPDSHPVRIPQVVTFASYDIDGGAGLSLSSGEWFTFHQDFWNAWDPDQMSELVDTCIARSLMCRVRTTPALVQLGQYVVQVPRR